MNLSNFSLRRPVTITILIMAVLVFGFLSSTQLKKNLLPPISYPTLVVASIYPNADPETVESMVTVKLEKILRAVQGVEHVRSMSLENVSVCQVEFNWSTNLIDAEQNIKSNLETLKLQLDEAVSDPIILKFSTSQISVLNLSIGVENEDIGEVSERIKDVIIPAIESADGVAGVSVFGTTDKVINVEYDQEALAGTGLTPILLQQYLQYQNISVPAGVIEETDQRYNLKVGKKFASVDDIKALVIGLKDSSEATGIFSFFPNFLTVGDVANVEETYTKPSGYSRVNGVPSCLVQVQGQPDESPVIVAKNVLVKLAALQSENPDIVYDITFDQSDFITKSLDDITQSAILGAIFAILIIMFFLRNFKTTLIIGVSIPLSLIMTILGMVAFKQTLNLMTMGGLSLGIGMLVDNSIVVLENIYRRIEMGDTPQHAAIIGTKEVSAAITASTFTTLVVFVPLVMIKGLVSSLFTSLAFTVVISVASSLLVALTVVPLLASRLIKKTDIAKDENIEKKRKEGKLNKFYRGILKESLRKPIKVYIAIGLMLVICGFIFPHLNFGLLPSMDMRRIDCKLALPNGSTLAATDSASKELEELVLALPAVKSVAASIGQADSNDYTSLVSGTYINTFSLTVLLKEKDKTPIETVADQIRSIISEKNSTVDEKSKIDCFIDTSGFGSFSLGGALDVFAKTVELKIKGESNEVINNAANAIKEALSANSTFTDISTSASRVQPVMLFDIDRTRALLGGLTIGQIGLGLRNSIIGITATYLEKDGESIPVVVMPKSLDTLTLEKALDIPISTSLDGIAPGGGTLSSLMGDNSFMVSDGSDVITRDVIEPPQVVDGPMTINREDGIRYATVTMGFKGVGQTQAVKVALDIANSLEISDIDLSVGGSQSTMDSAFGDLKSVLLLAIMLVYMVMAIQYESFVQPFIVMFTLPLAVVGAIVFVWLFGMDIGIMTLIGAITLVGVVVNNGIVMVDYTNQLRATGMSAREAVEIAAEARLRPILMTALTTSCALIPMMLGLGSGSELQKPLGITVSGGLFIATFLTLVVIPVIYILIDKIVEKFNMKAGKKYEAE